MHSNRFRIRFSKAGDLRFLSHHDLMRLFERMMRRAALPFKNTEGFHPKPKMAFASALGLGIVGLREVVEIELDGELKAEEIQHRLAEQTPAGMEILSVQATTNKTAGQVRRAEYAIALDSAIVPELAKRIPAVMAQKECWVERTRPERRRINIRPYLCDLRLEDNVLVMELEITPQGSARAEDVLKLLELDHLLTDGVVLERRRLELHDESNVS